MKVAASVNINLAAKATLPAPAVLERQHAKFAIATQCDREHVEALRVG